MQIHPGEGVKPISDFRKDTAQILKQLKEKHEPILLTQHGHSVAVLLDIETFERLEYSAHLRASYSRGVRDLGQGRSRKHEEVERFIKDTL